jgi:hypothetical protein
MSSAAKALANRQNSLHSTGPVTAAGKAVSSQNAMRHGLTSKQIVLPGEDAEHYDELRQDLLRIYRPANAAEAVLVEEVAAASWRLMRVRRQETLILEKLAGDDPNRDAGFAAAFIEKPKEIARLIRYITTIERAYYRAMSKLEQIQRERIAAEEQAAMELALREHHASKSRTGFVSQPQPVAMAAAANLPLPAQHVAAAPRL